MGYGVVEETSSITQGGSALKHSTKDRRLRKLISRFRDGFLQQRCEKLFDALPTEEVMRAVSEEVKGWRERLFEPLVTLRLFVEQMLHADHACQDVEVRYASERENLGESAISLSTGPYCKARQRLPLNLVRRLGKLVGRRLEESCPAVWRWRARPVKLIDGTTVSMPDTEDNQSAYPQPSGQKRGLGQPLARLVAVISLGCGTVLDWAMGPCKGKQTGEDALLRQLLGAFNPGDIGLVDRYHCTYFTIALLQRAGVDLVTRQHSQRTTDFRRGARLGKRDHLVHWQRPARPAWLDKTIYAEVPEQLLVRETKMGEWVLVTTLTDPKQVSKQEINALYVQRWQIEVDLRAIKIVMGMDILRCKSADMVRKEVAAFMLAYNLIRAVMGQAAACAKLLPRQLSFSGAKRVINGLLDMFRTSTRRLTRMFAHVRGAIASLQLPHRPNRVESRAVKRRPKPRRLLTEPRNIAREKLRRAHPILA